MVVLNCIEMCFSRYRYDNYVEEMRNVLFKEGNKQITLEYNTHLFYLHIIYQTVYN